MVGTLGIISPRSMRPYTSLDRRADVATSA